MPTNHSLEGGTLSQTCRINCAMAFRAILCICGTAYDTHSSSSFVSPANNPSGTVCTPASPKLLARRNIATNTARTIQRGQSESPEKNINGLSCVSTGTRDSLCQDTSILNEKPIRQRPQGLSPRDFFVVNPNRSTARTVLQQRAVLYTER